MNVLNAHRHGLPARSILLAATALALVLALGGVLVAQSAAGQSGAGSSRTPPPTARAASTYLTGIGDEQTEMFGNPLWQQLHTKIVRYIAPYDAVAHSYSLDRAIVWIRAAEAHHQKILVAFYHSEYNPTRMPSVALYQRDVQRFVRLFPNVTEYQAWDESNRGYIPHLLSSPSATLDAQYYQALRRVCRRCTVVGLDVLDQANIGPTLQYIAEFKREVYRLRTTMPTVWGLHDYSDINRFESWRTRDIAAVLPGQVWLTETGGLVPFGGAFPNVRGSGLRRAARAIRFMFAVAASNPRVKRLYIYDWTGGTRSTRFDAGLMDARFRPRAGYLEVCRHLRAPRCTARAASD